MTARSLSTSACLCLLAATLGLAGSSGAADEHAFEDEILAFEATDRVIEPPANAVVFVGSSTFRLWQDLARLPAPVAALNRGFGGSTIPDLRWYADRIILRYAPAAVVIYGGDNDLAAGRTPADVERGVLDLVTYLEGKQPGIRIGIVSVKPSPARAWLLPATRDANVRLRRLVDAKPVGRLFLDAFHPMLDAAGAIRPELYAADGLHMNAAGYDLWTPLVRDFVFALMPTVATRLEVSVTAGDDPARPVFVSGNLPALGPWRANGLRLQRDTHSRRAGDYVTTLAVPVGVTLEYKYTRGTWSTVEKTAIGQDVANRRVKCTAACASQDAVARFGGTP